MLSLRMDPRLIRSLRKVAAERGTTVSELLRQAASEIVIRETVPSVVTFREVPSGSVQLGRTSPVGSHSRTDVNVPSNSPTGISTEDLRTA